MEQETFTRIESVEHLGVHQNNRLRIGAGPLGFLVLLLLPLPFLPWQERGALGMLLWMTWWWVDGSISPVITAMLPVALTAVIPIAPAAEIVTAYSHPIVFLIAGSCIIGACWQRWGLGRRIALKILSVSGNSVRRQIWIWFLLAAGLSSIIADTITAAVFVPVAASLLAYSGFETNTQVWESKEATAILLAVAWGASIGSLPTPIGGGQNLIIYSFLTEFHGREVMFHSWFLNMFPFVLVLIPLVGFYLSHIVQHESVSLPGSREHFTRELKSMGSFSRGELFSGLAFLIAVLVIFLRPLYAELIPWFDPAFLFFAAGFVLFFIPAQPGENVLSFKVFKHFPIHILIIWPSALALARVLELSGLSETVISILEVFAGRPFLIISLIFVGVVALITNLTTNTASAALMMPIIISIFVEQGLNPIPLVMALIVAVNLAFAIPSGNGCLAVSSGYGINLRTMFKHGIVLTVMGWVITSFLAYFLEAYIPWWGVL